MHSLRTKDFQTQKNFYEIPTQMNKMKIISYKKGISTSNIIERIKKKGRFKLI